jgi:excisionase family DNA binding protein
MSSAARAIREPRYGSAAELASYTGLSVKTIRRLVDAGKVRGRKVGRRLLIPYEDLDRHILSFEDHRRDDMRPTASSRNPAIGEPVGSPAPGSIVGTAGGAVLPRRATDDRGRLIRMTEDEVRARAESVARGLDALDFMGDEAEQRQTLDALMVAIDEDRLSDRKRFR